eukprot:gnl/Spiro4/29484_TR14440_c0_g1_i1.p1 gnl/Spiro4/29484_TR14440_c0_g1~~gnl/Spiro4/29484_TR14440_c0_g1_i1.p1  ORF type:complete len:153 (+),score=2.63 gnl/Spiro4/29484_TR14440_c0_g1_i1:387-845(+)
MRRSRTKARVSDQRGRWLQTRTATCNVATCSPSHCVETALVVEVEVVSDPRAADQQLERLGRRADHETPTNQIFICPRVATWRRIPLQDRDSVARRGPGGNRPWCSGGTQAEFQKRNQNKNRTEKQQSQEKVRPHLRTDHPSPPDVKLESLA